MAVTAALVKELRDRTGAGMMDCKKALTATDGDIELAIENMRKSGAAKAAKKAGNVAAEGAIIVKDANGVAVLLEVNCQTDFVAKDANFTAFANEVADAALASKASVEELQAQFEEVRIALVAKIGENINIRRVQYVEGAEIASYRHGEKIGVVVAGEGDADLIPPPKSLHQQLRRPIARGHAARRRSHTRVSHARPIHAAPYALTRAAARGGHGCHPHGGGARRGAYPGARF